MHAQEQPSSLLLSLVVPCPLQSVSATHGGGIGILYKWKPELACAESADVQPMQTPSESPAVRTLCKPGRRYEKNRHPWSSSQCCLQSLIVATFDLVKRWSLSAARGHLVFSITGSSGATLQSSPVHPSRQSHTHPSLLSVSSVACPLQ